MNISLLNVYLIVSTGLLGFVASLWSSHTMPNILTKTALVASTLAGTVLIAKTIL